jgi:hypothetical protein
VQHNAGLASVTTHFLLQNLHSDARWAAFVHKVGASEPSTPP